MENPSRDRTYSLRQSRRDVPGWSYGCRTAAGRHAGCIGRQWVCPTCARISVRQTAGDIGKPKQDEQFAGEKRHGTVRVYWKSPIFRGSKRLTAIILLSPFAALDGVFERQGEEKNHDGKHPDARHGKRNAEMVGQTPAASPRSPGPDCKSTIRPERPRGYEEEVCPIRL